MNTVASVSPSPSGTSLALRAINWIASVYSTRTVKSTGKVNGKIAGKTVSSQVFSTAQNIAPADSQTVPLGLLMSVSQPAGGNLPAGLDYDALRTALRSDNVTAAQQAYARLQNDLLLGSSSNFVAASNSMVGSGHLDITV